MAEHQNGMQKVRGHTSVGKTLNLFFLEGEDYVTDGLYINLSYSIFQDINGTLPTCH